MVSKCNKCNVNINFKEIPGKPIQLKGMYVKPKSRWIPVNEKDGRNHFESCLKKDDIIFCVECGELSHCGGVFMDWEQWIVHREVFGHGRYRRRCNVVAVCRCLKYCL